MEIKVNNDIDLRIEQGVVKIIGKTEEVIKDIEENKVFYDDMSKKLTRTLHDLLKDYHVQKRWRESDYNG